MKDQHFFLSAAIPFNELYLNFVNIFRNPEKGFIAECSTCAHLNAEHEEQRVPSQSEPISGIHVKDVEAILLRAANDVEHREVAFQLAAAVQKWMRHSNVPASLDFVEKFINALLKVRSCCKLTKLLNFMAL